MSYPKDDKLEIPFDGKMAVYKPDWHGNGSWDNVEKSCHVCDKRMLRNTGMYVYWPDSKFVPIKNFFVCSKECGEMFILQRS